MLQRQPAMAASPGLSLPPHRPHPQLSHPPLPAPSLPQPLPRPRPPYPHPFTSPSATSPHPRDANWRPTDADDFGDLRLHGPAPQGQGDTATYPYASLSTTRTLCTSAPSQLPPPSQPQPRARLHPNCGARGPRMRDDDTVSLLPVRRRQPRAHRCKDVLAQPCELVRATLAHRNPHLPPADPHSPSLRRSPRTDSREPRPCWLRRSAKATPEGYLPLRTRRQPAPPCTFPRHLSSKPSVEVLAALPTDAPYSSSTSLAATRNSMCGNDVLPSAHFFTDVPRVPPPLPRKRSSGTPNGLAPARRPPPNHRSVRRNSGPHDYASPARATRLHGIPRPVHARLEPGQPKVEERTPHGPRHHEHTAVPTRRPTPDPHTPLQPCVPRVLRQGQNDWRRAPAR